MNVVGHDRPRGHAATCSLEVAQCFRHDAPHCRITQHTTAMAAIQVLFDPDELFFLERFLSIADRLIGNRPILRLLHHGTP